MHHWHGQLDVSHTKLSSGLEGRELIANVAQPVFFVLSSQFSALTLPIMSHAKDRLTIQSTLYWRTALGVEQTILDNFT